MSKLTCTVILSLFFSIVATVSGQDLPSNNTTAPFVGTGVAQFKRPADRLVASIPFRASGSDVRVATAALKQKIDAAKTQLTELGADENSLIASAMVLDRGIAESSRRMMMLLQRQGSSSNNPFESEPLVNDKEKAVPVVAVAASLRGEWALSGADGAEILAAAWELQEAILGAGFDDDESGEDLSPEEQEMLEEARMFGTANDEEIPAEPVFVFVARMAEEQRSALLKEAFRKAKDEAAELANATGSKLGILEFVRNSSEFPESIFGDNYGDSRYSQIQSLIQDLQSAGGALMMMGETPSELTTSVQVTAGFKSAE